MTEQSNTLYVELGTSSAHLINEERCKEPGHGNDGHPERPLDQVPGRLRDEPKESQRDEM